MTYHLSWSSRDQEKSQSSAFNTAAMSIRRFHVRLLKSVATTFWTVAMRKKKGYGNSEDCSMNVVMQTLELIINDR